MSSTPAKLAIASAEQAYASAGASDRLRVIEAEQKARAVERE